MAGRLAATLRSMSLWAMIALFAGLASGAAIGAAGPVPTGVVDGVQAIGGLWLSALQMTVAPLIFAALVTGIAAAADAAATGKLAARAVVLFVSLVGLIALLTIVWVQASFVVWPVDADSARALVAGAGSAGPPPEAPGGGFAGWLQSLAPQNPIKAAAENAVLPLVLFGAFFGFAVTRLQPEPKALMIRLFDAVTETMIVIVRWVLLAAPIGVFCLALALALRGGLGSAGAILHYVILASAACCATLLVAIPLAIFVGRAPPARFARAMAPVLAVAVSTQSSLACLPVMLEQSRDTLGLSERTSGVVLPLAVAIFRLTSPAGNLAVALFIAHVSGIQLSPGVLFAAGLVSIAVSIAAVGLPGQVSFILSMAPICLVMGLPLDLLPLLLAVEIVPDIFRTIGNVAGDMSATAVLGRDELRDDAAAEPGPAL